MSVMVFQVEALHGMKKDILNEMQMFLVISKEIIERNRFDY